MAQTFFDVLAGTVDSQTHLAVASILDGQTGEHAHFSASQEGEDDDVFQCGKCKRQFTSLSTFVAHKQARCQDQNSEPDQSSHAPGSTTTIQTQQIILQGRMITDDLLNSFDPSSTTILQVQGANIKSNPFLSQIGPLTKPSSLEAVTLDAARRVVSLDVGRHGSAAELQASASAPAAPELLTTDRPAYPQAGDVHQAKQQSSGRQGVKMSAVKRPGPDKLSTVRQELLAKRTPVSAVDDIIRAAKTEKTKLNCNFCNKQFAKNFDLNVHMRTHTGEKPYQCIVCGRAFAQKSNVKKHMASHKVWPNGRGETLPEYAFVTVIDTEAEAGDLDSRDEKNAVKCSPDGGKVLGVMMDTSYRCEYCSARFSTYNTLKKHMVHHKNQQVYKCVLSTCADTFKDLDAFLEHIKTHEEALSYTCHVCSRHFSSLYDLGVHQYSHSTGLVPPKEADAVPPEAAPTTPVRGKITCFGCPKCSARYASQEGLTHHLQTSSHHYPCVFCKRVFVCERFLRRHVLTHNVKSLECRICQKRFNTAGYLRVHLATHSTERPHQCDQCDSAFNRKDKLTRHQLLHNPHKKYKCPFHKMTGCDREFSRNDKLREHILTHGGHRPWACTVCGKTFQRASHAKAHQRQHHSSQQSEPALSRAPTCQHAIPPSDVACQTCTVQRAMDCDHQPSPADRDEAILGALNKHADSPGGAAGNQDVEAISQPTSFPTLAQTQEAADSPHETISRVNNTELAVVSPSNISEKSKNAELPRKRARKGGSDRSVSVRPRRSSRKPSKFSDYLESDNMEKSVQKPPMKIEKFSRKFAKVPYQPSEPKYEEKVQTMLKEARNSGVTMSIQTLIEASRYQEEQLLVGETSEVGDALVGGVSQAGDALVGGVSGAGDALVGGVSEAGDALVGGVSEAGDALVGGVSEAGDALVGGVSEVGDALVGGVSEVGDALVGGVSETGDALVGGVSEARDLPVPQDTGDNRSVSTHISVVTSTGIATIPVVFATTDGSQGQTFQIPQASSLNLMQTLSDCFAGQVVESKNADGTVTLSVFCPPSIDENEDCALREFPKT